MRQKLPLLLRSDPGAVDGFFTLPSWDMATFSRAGWYEPLDKYIHSDLTAADWDFADYVPNILSTHQTNGEQIGIPITLELQTLFNNKAMLAAKQLQAPQMLDQLMAAAKALNDSQGKVSGFVTRGDGVQAVIPWRHPWRPSFLLMVRAGSTTRASPSLPRPLSSTDWLYYGEILCTAGPPNIVGMQWKTTYPLFQQAHAAMFTDATNFIAFFKDR